MFPDAKGQNPYAPLVTDKNGNAVMAGGSPITLNAPQMQQSDPLAKAQQMQGMASLADDKLGLGLGDAFDAGMKGIGDSVKQAFMPISQGAPAVAGQIPLKSAAGPLVQTVAQPFNAATTVGSALNPATSAGVLEAFGGAGAPVGELLAAGEAAGAAASTAPAAAAGGAKGGAPIAAALGPIGIPLLIGGALYAASR